MDSLRLLPACLSSLGASWIQVVFCGCSLDRRALSVGMGQVERKTQGLEVLEAATLVNMAALLLLQVSQNGCPELGFVGHEGLGGNGGMASAGDRDGWRLRGSGGSTSLPGTFSRG